jgi:hypothetical protein
VAAMFFLYRGLSIGSMAIVAPISATGVILPVIVSLAGGDNPALLQKLGMAAAIIGAILASREKNKDDNGSRLATGVGLAVGSAIAAGIFFVVMDQASEADPYWAAFLMRFSYFALLIIIFLLKRPAVRAHARHCCSGNLRCPGGFCLCPGHHPGDAWTGGGCGCAISGRNGSFIDADIARKATAGSIPWGHTGRWRRHIHFSWRFVEAVSKPQIAFESPRKKRDSASNLNILRSSKSVPPELKTERTRKYLSISTRWATQLSDARWGFETASRHNCLINNNSINNCFSYKLILFSLSLLPKSY